MPAVVMVLVLLLGGVQVASTQVRAQAAAADAARALARGDDPARALAAATLPDAALASSREGSIVCATVTATGRPLPLRIAARSCAVAEEQD